MKVLKSFLTTFAMASCATTTFARGGVLIDNLDQPLRDITILGTSEPDRLWAAQAFSSPRTFALSASTLVLGQTVAEAMVGFNGVQPFGLLEFVGLELG